MTAALHAAETAVTNPWLNPLMPQPAELIIGLIFTAVLYWAVKVFFMPQFEANYAARVESIEGGIKKAEAAQAEAAEALAQYQAQLADSRAQSSRIREEARAEGAAIIAELRVQAQAEADRITAAAQQQIEAERQQAVVQLRAEVGRLAIDLASRIVGEALADEARQSMVVERFLTELEGQSATVGQGA